MLKWNKNKEESISRGQQILGKFKNPKATARKSKKLRKLIRDNLLQRADPSLKSKYDDFDDELEKVRQKFDQLERRKE